MSRKNPVIFGKGGRGGRRGARGDECKRRAAAGVFLQGKSVVAPSFFSQQGQLSLFSGQSPGEASLSVAPIRRQAGEISPQAACHGAARRPACPAGVLTGDPGGHFQPPRPRFLTFTRFLPRSRESLGDCHTDLLPGPGRPDRGYFRPPAHGFSRRRHGSGRRAVMFRPRSPDRKEIFILLERKSPC